MKFIFTLAIAALIFAVASPQHANCDTVDLTIDQSQSDADISINGSDFENSEVSGTGVLEIDASTEPFGVAQITALDLVLEEGLTFQLLGAQVTLTTQPSDVTISLVTPGAGSTVTAGTFDQLGNIMAFGGLLDVDDPLSLIGGDQTIDLATLAPNPVDFIAAEVSRSGNTITVSGTFSITDDIQISPGVFIPLIANGSYVATGAVPEPGSSACLVGFAFAMLVRRKRQR